VSFAKRKAIRYTSHLDLARAWARAFHRSGIPLAYSLGFNPRPRIQLAAALPLGHTGAAEILDVWLEQRVGDEEFLAALVGNLPDGLSVTHARQVEPRGPALQTQVTSSAYRVTLSGTECVGALEARIAEVKGATELPHEWRRRRYDLRPLIEELQLVGAHGIEAVLRMQLAARPGATARPEAVVAVLGVEHTFAEYHRLRLLLTSAGGRLYRSDQAHPA
jgi:radical SAM-linked protein